MGGAQGPMGPLGPAGAQICGATGPDGSQGATGAASWTGEVGPTGPMAMQSPTGPLGPLGSPGSQGISGPAGPTGTILIAATGPGGLGGRPGNTGLDGDIGGAGSDGGAGPTGQQADPGDLGPLGPLGLIVGCVGSTGPAGAAGVQGDPGSLGATGYTGGAGGMQMGPPGTTGPVGVLGKAGAAGLLGLPGQQGPIGSTGRYSFDALASSGSANLLTSGAVYTSTQLLGSSGVSVGALTVPGVLTAKAQLQIGPTGVLTFADSSASIAASATGLCLGTTTADMVMVSNASRTSQWPVWRNLAGVSTTNGNMLMDDGNPNQTLGQALTTGIQNTALVLKCGIAKAASGNFITGYNAGWTEGNNNIIIGAYAQSDATTYTGLNNSIVLNPVYTNFTPYVNGFHICNSSLACFKSASNVGAYPVYWNSTTGSIFGYSSTQRVKENIVDLTHDTRVLYDVRACEYTADGTQNIGYIAEELAVAAPALATLDPTGSPITADYNAAIVYAAAELRKLAARTTVLETRSARA